MQRRGADEIGPLLFPNPPPPSALTALSQPQTIWRKVPTLTEPYYIQSSFSVERALPKNTTLSISFVNTRGLHQLRSRNLNAPAPVTGIRPYGNAFNIYDYETSGSYWQNLLMTNLTTRFNRRGKRQRQRLFTSGACDRRQTGFRYALFNPLRQRTHRRRFKDPTQWQLDVQRRSHT